MLPDMAGMSMFLPHDGDAAVGLQRAHCREYHIAESSQCTQVKEQKRLYPSSSIRHDSRQAATGTPRVRAG